MSTRGFTLLGRVCVVYSSDERLGSSLPTSSDVYLMALPVDCRYFLGTSAEPNDGSISLAKMVVALTGLGPQLGCWQRERAVFASHSSSTLAVRSAVEPEERMSVPLLKIGVVN
jgi:hypothetical protein